MKNLKFRSMVLPLIILFFCGCEDFISDTSDLKDIKNSLQNSDLHKYKSNLSNDLAEMSGIIYYNDIFWIINDGGNDEIIYGIDPTTGEITQKIYIENIQNTDWEDISQDNNSVYIGDFGNNDGSRQDLRILKIDKSMFPETGDGNAKASIIEFYFEDQTSFEGSSLNTSYDCEALVVINDTVHVFSKDWINQITTIYTFPAKEGKWEAKIKNKLTVHGLVTAADINTLTNTLILAGYTKTYIPFLATVEHYYSPYLDLDISSNFKFLSNFGTQIEGVCFFEGDTIILSSEKSEKTDISQKLYYYQ